VRLPETHVKGGFTEMYRTYRGVARLCEISVKMRISIAIRSKSQHDTGMIRQFFRVVFTAGVTGLIGLAFRPYHDGALRYGLPLSLVALLSGGLFLFWRRKILRIALLAVPVLCAVPFFLPGKPISQRELSTRYVSALGRMEGVPYLWGGEGRRGVDCSGLPRRALRDALLEIAIETGNATALREWAEQWWYDTSARALGNNYRGFTRPLGVAGKLRDLDFSRLSVGDLAVTGDGRHVMVYFDTGTWIQADPGPWKVAIGNPKTDKNPWFDCYVTLHRWMLLE
jgi:hypothetical protein